MGDFEEVERLQAGIRTWLLRTARNGRHELRGISAPAVLPLLCAAAFGPALADADGQAPGLARMGVLVSVGADVLAHLLEAASSQARSAAADAPDLTRSLEAEISRSVREVLDLGGSAAGELRSDIAMVMREIDAGGTAFRAAIEPATRNSSARCWPRWNRSAPSSATWPSCCPTWPARPARSRTA
jgi:hypothetical protein